VIQVGDLVEEAVGLIKAGLPPDVDVRVDIDPDTPPVLADPTQIHQVVVNLATNAGYAMKESGGTLQVSVTQTSPDDAGSGRGGQALVRIRFEDTGKGIPLEAQARVLEPFFTTKPLGEGTGLGLSVVHGIVLEHGGRLDMHSVPGTGTTFDVLLPAIATPGVTDSDAPRVDIRGDETVWVVDDQPEVLELVGDGLEPLGYRVTAFGAAEDALTEFQRAPDVADVVVVDELMPRMSGSELVKRLRSVRPDVPLVLISGYLGQPDNATRRSPVDAIRLSKPFTPSELAGAIRRALAGVRIS